VSPRPAQAGHRIILTTLHRGIGSWAPAQVTDARPSESPRRPAASAAAAAPSGAGRRRGARPKRSARSVPSAHMPARCRVLGEGGATRAALGGRARTIVLDDRGATGARGRCRRSRPPRVQQMPWSRPCNQWRRPVPSRPVRHGQPVGWRERAHARGRASIAGPGRRGAMVSTEQEEFPADGRFLRRVEQRSRPDTPAPTRSARGVCCSAVGPPTDAATQGHARGVMAAGDALHTTHRTRRTARRGTRRVAERAHDACGAVTNCPRAGDATPPP
jgi:hypothetical protein